MVNMARETDWRKTASAYRDENGVIRKAFEDECFGDKLVAEPLFFKGRTWAMLPGLEVARAFAVGMCFADEPFGYEGALGKHEGRRAEILERCPEISLLLDAEEQDWV
jgi:hypothetical protein